jgi:hypothetical protein
MSNPLVVHQAASDDLRIPNKVWEEITGAEVLIGLMHAA